MQSKKRKQLLGDDFFAIFRVMASGIMCMIFQNVQAEESVKIHPRMSVFYLCHPRQFTLSDSSKWLDSNYCIDHIRWVVYYPNGTKLDTQVWSYQSDTAVVSGQYFVDQTIALRSKNSSIKKIDYLTHKDTFKIYNILPEFSVNKDRFCEGDTIKFINQTKNRRGLYLFEWNFEAGSYFRSKRDSILHIYPFNYNTVGTRYNYYPYLIAIDSNGCSYNSEEKPITIYKNRLHRSRIVLRSDTTGHIKQKRYPITAMLGGEYIQFFTISYIWNHGKNLRTHSEIPIESSGIILLRIKDHFGCTKELEREVDINQIYKNE